MILLAKARCEITASCPAIYLSEDDTIVFVGHDIEPELRASIAHRIGPGEEAVQVDAELMHEAMQNLQALLAERESRTVSRWGKLKKFLRKLGKMLG